MMDKEEVAEMRAAMKARAQERAVEAEPLIHGLFMAAAVMSGQQPGVAIKTADAALAKWSEKWIDGPAAQA
jgi:hypothetical protein